MDDSSTTPPRTHGRKRLRTRSGRKHPELRRSCRRKKPVDFQRSLVSSSSPSSSNSSSGSDSEDNRSCKRSRSMSNLDRLLKTPVGKGGKRNILAEIQPITVDRSLTFRSVGGLQSHIDKLKEMVIFPLFYKEFFAKRGVTPPRGVLFHGPPGTGKTLLARALAAEASCAGGREVTIFVRKGADVLNKWIGESERHLKLLFEQAVLKQPSIIFFDEIDGLAPVRSTKTDQIHNSVVSTLLAEMDGLKDRGDIVVIGATNRIDTLDAALRRPGRFDLELSFLLPSFKGRRDIFEINVSTWNPPLSEQMIDELAVITVGYSGADIKLLCAEASLCALRRRYPQIYRSTQKLLLDYDSIKVELCDWEEAMKVVGRSSDRSVFSSFFTPLPLPKALAPLLSRSVDEIRQQMKQLFPYKSKMIFQPSARALLIDMGVNHDILEHVISACLWDTVDGVPIHVLTIQTLSTKTISLDDGSGIALFFSEVKREKVPSVIYIPYFDHFMESLGPAAQLVFDQELSRISFYPFLIIAFCKKDSLSEDMKERFKEFKPSAIGTKERCAFFRDILSSVTRIKVPRNIVPEEELPIAPPEPVKMNPEQLAWTERSESRILRELRAFLREVIFKLLRRKKFEEFSKPVDPKEVPDYLSVISHPMDLETMMVKVTDGKYHSALEFLQDINLIVENCLEYNPMKTNEDRERRRTAYELKDVAESIIEKEMDSDFEANCIKITKRREERSAFKEHGDSTPVNSSQYGTPQSGLIEVQTPTSSTMTTRRKGHIQRKRPNIWARGVVKKTPLPKRRTSTSSGSAAGAQNGVSTTSKLSTQRRTRLNSATDPTPKLPPVSEIVAKVKVEQHASSTSLDSLQLNNGSEPDADGCIPFNGNTSDLKEYKAQLKKMYEALIRNTMTCCVSELLEVRFQLLALIEEHGKLEDKPELIKKLWNLIESLSGQEA